MVDIHLRRKLGCPLNRDTIRSSLAARLAGVFFAPLERTPASEQTNLRVVSALASPHSGCLTRALLYAVSESQPTRLGRDRPSACRIHDHRTSSKARQPAHRLCRLFQLRMDRGSAAAFFRSFV